MSQYVAHGQFQLQKVAGLVGQLNPQRKWRIEITQHQQRRTLSQNKLYWCVLTEMANETGHTKEEMHDAMKTMFLPQTVMALADEEIHIPASSAKLDKKAFTDYIERVIAFAATELGITV